MPTITFDDIPNQFGPVFELPPPLGSGQQVGFRGYEYSEDGFIIHARLGPPPPFFNQSYRASMDSPIVPSSNYFITGEDLPFLNGTPLILTRPGGDTFGVQSIKLDGILFGFGEIVTFTGTDLFGVVHQQGFITDPLPGFQTFTFQDDFQSNLVSLTWSGVNWPIVNGNALNGFHLPLADDIEMINVTPTTKLDKTPPALNITTFTVFNFSSDGSDASFEYRLDGGNWVSTSDHFVELTVSAAEHKFEVRAVHGALVDPTPAVFSWTADDRLKVLVDLLNEVTIKLEDPEDLLKEALVKVADTSQQIQMAHDAASHTWTAAISGLSQGRRPAQRDLVDVTMGGEQLGDGLLLLERLDHVGKLPTWSGGSPHWKGWTPPIGAAPHALVGDVEKAWPAETVVARTGDVVHEGMDVAGGRAVPGGVSGLQTAGQPVRQ
jgi:hypothetical protein